MSLEERLEKAEKLVAEVKAELAAMRATKRNWPERIGAELVGKVCEFSDSPTGPWSPGLCAAFGHNQTYQYRKAGGAEWRYARLAK